MKRTRFSEEEIMCSKFLLPNKVTGSTFLVVTVLLMSISLTIGAEAKSIATKDSRSTTLDSLIAQAAVHEREGRYRLADDIYARIVTQAKNEFGEEHPSYLNALKELARLKAILKRNSEAEALYRKVVKVSERIFGEGHPYTAGTLQELAKHLRDSRISYAEAETLLRRVLDIHKQDVGVNHPRYADVLEALASVLMGNSDTMDQGQSTYEQALVLRQKHYEDNQESIVTASALARLQFNMGHYADANKLYQHVLVKVEEKFGRRTFQYIEAKEDIARSQEALRAYSQAEPAYRQVLLLREEILGPSHPDNLDAIERLARIYETLGVSSRAEEFRQRALNIKRATFGEKSPHYLRDLSNFADAQTAFESRWTIPSTDEQRSRLESVASLYREFVDSGDGVIDQWETVAALEDLATVYSRIGEYQKAEDIHQQLFEIDEAGDFAYLQSSDHAPEARLAYADALEWDAVYVLYCAPIPNSVPKDVCEEFPPFGPDATEPDYVVAESALEQSLTIRERHVGTEHPEYAAGLDILADLYEVTGRHREASLLRRRASKVYEKMGHNAVKFLEQLRQKAASYRAVWDGSSGDNGYEYLVGLQNRRSTFLLGAIGNIAILPPANVAQIESLYRRMVRVSELSFPVGHPERLRILNESVDIYIASGDYQMAADLYGQIIDAEVANSPLSNGDADRAMTSSKIAWIYFMGGAFDQADIYHKRASEIFGRIQYDPLSNGSEAFLDRYGDIAKHVMELQAIADQKYQIDSSLRGLGEKDPDYVDHLARLADLYKILGDLGDHGVLQLYTRAKELYEEVLTVLDRVGASQDDHEFVILELASVYESLESLDEAANMYAKALNIVQSSFTEESFAFTYVLEQTVSFYERMNRWVLAAELYESVASIEFRDYFLEQHVQRLYSNFQVRRSEALDEAIWSVQEGEEAEREGLYQSARFPYEVAVRVVRENVGEDHPDYADALRSLARSYSKGGFGFDAEPILRQALAILDRRLGERHPDYARCLKELGGVLLSIGRYVEAEEVLKVSMMNLKDQPDLRIDHAEVLQNMGGLNLATGAYAEALMFYQESLAILEQEGADEYSTIASVLDGLAATHIAMGSFDQAEPLLHQALSVVSQTKDAKVAVHDDILSKLAAVHAFRGEFAQAEALYWDARFTSGYWGEKFHPGQAMTVDGLADLYLRAGVHWYAEELYNDAMAIRRNSVGPQHRSYGRSLQNLGQLHAAKGELAKAVDYLEDALKVSRGVMDQVALIQSERRQLVLSQSFKGQLDAYLSVAVAKGGLDAQAFEQVLVWKGATLVRQRQYREVAQEREVAERFRQLQEVVRSLSTLARSFPKDEGDMMSWRERLNELNRERDRLEIEIAQDSAAFRRAQTELQVKDVAAALPDDSVLLDFLEYNRTTEWGMGTVRSLVAFVVRSNGVVSMVDLGPSDDITAAVETWRGAFVPSDSERDLPPLSDGIAAASLIRGQVWEPLVPEIEDVTVILVSVDGALGRFPLAALPGSSPGTYVIEEYALAYVPVPQLLPILVTNETDDSRRRLLLMGGMNYDADDRGTGESASGGVEAESDFTLDRISNLVRGHRFEQLDQTLGEISVLENLFKNEFGVDPADVISLDRKRATEGMFRQLAPQYDVLHLATHGFFVPPERQDEAKLGGISLLTELYGGGVQVIRDVDPGLFSGIVFSGANQPPRMAQDDGILTAMEIASLPLTGVDLVTLSACESGLGIEVSGEGLLGVQRAFQVAGARSTIASLWSVRDAATRYLMERFYRNLWERRMSGIDALREAQLWMLRHPAEWRGAKSMLQDTHEEVLSMEWAAFLLSGKWW